MLKRWLCQAEVTVDLHCLDPLLVKSGQPTLDGPDMVPIVSFRHGEREYFIPGSSLKGVFRSHIERLIRTLNQESVCVPYINNPRNDDPRNDLHMSCSARMRKVSNTAERYRLSCPACRTFGSLSFTGRLTVSDALPVGKKPIVEERDGVAIDRFSGGAARGAKFNMTVISAGTFRTTISIRNFELWQLGLLQIFLSDLEQGLIRIGSGTSRGLGRVQGTVERYSISYVQAQDSLVGLGELCTPEERSMYGLYTSQHTPMPLGEAEVRGLHHRYDVADRYQEFLPTLTQVFIDFIKQGYSPNWLTQIKKEA